MIILVVLLDMTVLCLPLFLYVYIVVNRLLVASLDSVLSLYTGDPRFGMILISSICP
jgi:hypothetical protein